MLAGEEHVDVAVVGAGLAGIMTAWTLEQRGKHVAVFEGRDRVGGRLLTRRTTDGLCVDLGGQWIGPGQKRMEALTRDLNVTTHPTAHRGKTRYDLDGSCGASRLGFPAARPLALLGLALSMNRIEKAARRVRERPPWSRYRDPIKEGSGDMSVGRFIDERVWPEAARATLRGVFEGIFCRNPSEFSLDLALYAIGASGGLSHMQAVQGGAQERQISSGAGDLAVRLASRLQSPVRLNAVVHRIERHGHEVLVQSSKSSLSAKRVVLTVPPPLLSAIEFEPPLSQARRNVTRESTMGNVLKCCLLYEEPFWRNSGLSGTLWSTKGPINMCYDTSPPGTNLGVLSALAVGRSAVALIALPEAKRRSLVLQSLSVHFGIQALHPREYFDLAWDDEPLSGGGFSVTLAPNSFAAGPALFQNAEGLAHFAGTETAREYPGYMEGAIESAERVAEEVLRALG